MTTWVTGIRVLTLFVDDLAACTGFYERVFEVPCVYSDDDSAVFSFGNVLVNLLTSSSAAALVEPAPVARSLIGSRAVLTLSVDDVDAICDLLASRGVRFLNGPVDRPWGVRTATFLDPGGHAWELARDVDG